MHADSLAVVRTTKLDLAQWIAAGIGGCHNPGTSLCLARYAGAQLESAALIPASSLQRSSNSRSRSLLRQVLKDCPHPNGNECVQVLVQVSQAMITALSGNSRKDANVDLLIRHEANASREIRALCRVRSP